MRKLVLLFIFGVFIFMGCKKYPENTLWFKKAEKAFHGGYITVYTVDDVDKMAEIRDLYKNFPYNYFTSSIEDVWALSFNYNGGSLSNELGEGYLTFSPSKKSVTIKFTPKNSEFGAKNIFVEEDNWSVEKLTKGGQMKLKGYFGSHTYVIQFN